MKNIKKNYLILIVGLILSLPSKSLAQDFSNLSNEKDFISYIDAELEFLSRVDIEKVKEINAEDLEDKNERNKFYEAFSTNESDYMNFLNSQNSKLNNLNKLYQFDTIQESELNDKLLGEVDQVLATYAMYSGGNCERRYRNALAINFSAAVAGHIACGTADITVVLGIICHGAVGLAHVAANDDALLDYQECLK